MLEEVRRAGLYREVWQSFAVLPAIRSVGVMGDERTYAYPIVIRAVTSDDAMTADWAQAAVRPAGAHLEPHHQRGAGREPGGPGHLEQAAVDHRVGVETACPKSLGRPTSSDEDDGMPATKRIRRTGIPPRRPRVPHTSDALELVHRHALLAAATASALKGEDIRILDMHDLVTYTDYLVLCTGRSTRQTRRIAEEIGVRLKKEHGLMPVTCGRGQADSEGGEWILMDYLDFIVHVFTPETREFYRLDNLWKDAPVEIIE